uniref:Delta(1)-pyrroline-2-carboxylate reductase n=1 Tax=Thermorudis peleae TaxID=1382356 RepID=A0A831TD65_9BACT
MLALSRQDVYQLVPMRTAIELMKQVFRDLSAGQTVSPLRTPIEVPDVSGVTLFMPAYVPSAPGLGVKVVSVFPNNRALRKPTIHAIVVLVDTTTGEPVAVLDGTYLTALRTGAASGAATDLLARPDARVLTCIGAGAQGPTQAWAVTCVRPIETIYVYDINQDAVASFEQRLRQLEPSLAARVIPVGDLATALRESDVICTATTSRSPVFSDADLRPGVHINAIGAFTPEMQEIPPETVARAYVVVDSVEAALAEAGDLIKPLNEGLISRDHIKAELGQVVAGQAPGRTSTEQITFFKSVGNAVQDVIVAARAVHEAQASGRGQPFDLTR